MTSSATGTVTRRLSGRAASVVIAAVVLAGCGTSTTSLSPAAGSIVGVSLGPPGSASAATPAPTPRPTASLPSGAVVISEPTLLDVVPKGSFELTYDPDTTARVAADPSLAASATGLAIALATPAAMSSASSAAPGDDIAVVSVIHLRDPSVGEPWFRDWRDSYDAAACANAGGVVRRAQTEIGDKTVFIGSCAGGSFTYHVRVEEEDAVISLTSVGPANLGRTIMDGFAS